MSEKTKLRLRFFPIGSLLTQQSTHVGHVASGQLSMLPVAAVVVVVVGGGGAAVAAVAAVVAELGGK